MSVKEVGYNEGTRTGQAGRQLHYCEWTPSGKPKGLVVIAHGYAEHSGRYSALANDLAGHGYAVAALDHHGHGKSEGKAVSVRRFDDYVDDLRDYMNDVRPRYNVPTFLLGHSMGGLISLRYVTREQPDLAGLVVSATAASRPPDVSGATIFVGRILSRVAPDAGILALPLDKISRDPRVVKAYNDDPLVHARKMRARLGAEILDTIDLVAPALADLKLPMLIIHGGDDVISVADNSRLIYERSGTADKTLEIYDGLWHEVFNEPERDKVLADLVGWLDQHVPTLSGRTLS